MQTAEVIALADEVRAHLERGDLAGLGPVDLGPDGTFTDAERAARITLADVAHRLEEGGAFDRQVPGARWGDLADQLRRLDREVHRQLDEREAHLRDLAEQTPATLWATDAGLRVTSATGAGLAEIGRRPASGRTGPLSELLGDDPESPSRAAHRRALRGESAVYECAWRGRVYRAQVGPLRGPDGAIIGTVGAALDITEVKQVESVFRPGEERFRIALRASPIIVYSQDTELRHTWIYNPQHGFSAEAVLGKTDAELVRPEDAAILAVIKRRVMETGVGAREEVCVTVGGEPAYYDLTIEPLRGPAGEIVGVTGAATNVTALKRAEQALARREAQLAEAQRLAQLGSWELDFATNRFSWSDEHYRIFGVAPQVGPLTPALVQAPIHPDDLERSQAIFEASLRTGEPYETEFRVVRPDGEVRLIHSRGALLRDEAGRPERMVGTAQDITERRRAEEERAAQRERQARLHGMLFAARELAARMNDDLVESSGAIDLLRPQPALPPELRQAVDRLATRVSGVTKGIAELRRLLPAPSSEHPGGPPPDDGMPAPAPSPWRPR